MRTILIAAYHGWVYRNLLSNGRFALMLEDPDVRTILCVPPDKIELARKLTGGRAVVESFDAERIVGSRYNKFWHRLGFLIQNTQYVRDQRLERYWHNRNFIGLGNYQAVNAVAAILSQISLAVRLYRVLDYWFSSRSATSEILRKFSPDLVMAGDLFGEADLLFMRCAKANGIRTLGMVRSWDNTTTKGILRFLPDQIIANSPVIRDELRRIHRVRPESIAVVGLPQFDAWISGPTVEREEFFRSIGADPAKRLVLFAPAGRVLSDTDWQLCQILKDAIRDGRLPNDIVFLVRNHPQHPADLSKFEPDGHFVIENPGTRTRPNDYKGATLTTVENDHLRNSVYFSELVMYIATSIGLDATVFDKPQIIVSFDGWEARPIVRSVKRYNREDCLGNMVISGGTKVVEDASAWITAINAYLANPSLDREGRQRAREDHMDRVDGHAGERVASIIKNEIDNAI